MSETSQNPQLDLYSLSEGLRRFRLPDDEEIEYFDPEILPAIHPSGYSLNLEPVMGIDETLLTGFFAEVNLDLLLTEREGKKYRLTYHSFETESDPSYFTEITQLFGDTFRATLKDCRHHRGTDKISVFSELPLDPEGLNAKLRGLYCGSLLLHGSDSNNYAMLQASIRGGFGSITPEPQEIGLKLHERAESAKTTDLRRLPDIVATLHLGAMDDLFSPVENLELNLATEPFTILDDELLNQFAGYKLNIPELRQRAKGEHQQYCDTHVTYDAETGEPIPPGTRKAQ